MKINNKIKKTEILEYFRTYAEASKYFNISPSAISQWEFIPIRRVYELYNLKKIQRYISSPKQKGSKQ